MSHVRITYKVSTDKVEENIAAVQKFISAVKAKGDADYSYRSYQLNDGVTFMHVFWMSDESAKARFQGLPEFKEFADGLRSRALEQPSVVPMELVGASDSK